MWLVASWLVLATLLPSSLEQHMVSSSGDKKMVLEMPGARPLTDDSYLCSSFEVAEMTGTEDNVYVTGFAPKADANRAHHMLLYACNDPIQKPGVTYDCLHHSMCKDGSGIMFAWAKNAPPTTLPEDVGFELTKTHRKYLVLQVHYSKPLPEPDNTTLILDYQLEKPKFQAGILLLLTGGTRIPANTPVVHGDVNCKLPAKAPIHMFAYRTHAHSLGTVITGYVYNETSNEYREIARGSPQWPQAFYPMHQINTVNPGEYVAARCTWNSTGRDRDTYIGSTGGDEMCNLYIMFFYEPGEVDDYLGCVNEQEGDAITRGLPADSDVAPARNETLEHKAHDSSIDTGVNEISYGKIKLGDEFYSKTTSKKKGGVDEDSNVVMVGDYNFTMPGARPKQTDDYLCTPLKVSSITNGPAFAIQFSAIVKGNRAHHMILSSCKDPPGQEGEIWDCRHHHMCRDGGRIMFAWAKHAESTSLPEDVAFTIPHDEYIVLQVHYAKPLDDPDYSGLTIRFRDTEPKYTAGIYLLGVGSLYIPPDTPVTHGDANCKVDTKNPIHLFAYRTHAHNFGTVISGYRFSPNNNKWQMIAKGNPNWPQAFYPMEKTEVVNPGEILTARCTYNTTGHHTPTKIGSEGTDEMCNLYLMYYTVNKDEDFKICFNEEEKLVTAHLPAGNDVPLPPNPELESQAHGVDKDEHASHAHSHSNSVDTDSPPDDLSGVKKRPGAELSNVKKKPGVGDGQGREGKDLPSSDYSAVPNWPSKATADSLGQISGVAIDTYGMVVIFHRGDRTWNGNTFNVDNTYGGDRSVPIPQDTVITVNSTGHTINSWGKNLFFLPHMITVDSKNHIWMTDVAMHQVFKFPPYGGDQKPLIVLGEKFAPGNDDRHYCKPTSVAVSEDTKTFFVSDGYCNSRIIKYSITVDSEGKDFVKKVKEWGKGAGPFSITTGPYSFNVPHGLALAEEKNEICVADRENGRVQCFNTDSGEFTKTIKPDEFGSRIFSVAYTPAKGGKLLAVSGPEMNPFGKKPTGYIVSMDTGKLDGTWQVPGGLQNPHDVAVSKDGTTVYVVELSPFTIWKLTNGQPSQSVASLPPSLLPSPTSPSISSQAIPRIMEGAKKLMPEISSSVVIAAAISVPLTILVACCLAIRKCRKRGKGTKYKDNLNKKNWSVGDILGRSKEGFQPLNTEEKDGMLGDESDSEVEEFSVPAMHA